MSTISAMEPYVLAAGEGRKYSWHDVVLVMKAAGAETGGALSLWEVTTRPGEEPHLHAHDDVHEMFYVLDGEITFTCGDETIAATSGAFVFVPIGTPHTYRIDTPEVRMLGMSTPSHFGDNVERTGVRLE
ncbi:MAG: cupin domain-containing protein [Chloroflexota bacterium]